MGPVRVLPGRLSVSYLAILILFRCPEHLGTVLPKWKSMVAIQNASLLSRKSTLSRSQMKLNSS